MTTALFEPKLSGYLALDACSHHLEEEFCIEHKDRKGRMLSKQSCLIVEKSVVQFGAAVLVWERIFDSDLAEMVYFV